MNNCLLCHIGRTFQADFMSLEKLIEALQAYDLSKSPYPFSDSDRDEMIVYLRSHEFGGMAHFTDLEYFFLERDEKRYNEQKAAKDAAVE